MEGACVCEGPCILSFICFTVNLPLATTIVLDSDAQIPSTRSPKQLNCFQWHLIFFDPQYGTYFMSPFWLPEFYGGSLIFGKICAPWSLIYDTESVLHDCPGECGAVS